MENEMDIETKETTKINVEHKNEEIGQVNELSSHCVQTTGKKIIYPCVEGAQLWDGHLSLNFCQTQQMRNILASHNSLHG